MPALRPILRDLWNSDDRAARGLAVNSFHLFRGPDVYGNPVKVDVIAGVRIRSGIVGGSISPVSNAAYNGNVIHP